MADPTVREVVCVCGRVRSLVFGNTGFELEANPECQIHGGPRGAVRKRLLARRHPDELGRRVREVWVAWAKTQPDPKPHWLTPWDELAEPDKEVDRLIGAALYDAGYCDASDDGHFWTRICQQVIGSGIVCEVLPGATVVETSEPGTDRKRFVFPMPREELVIAPTVPEAFAALEQKVAAKLRDLAFCDFDGRTQSFRIYVWAWPAAEPVHQAGQAPQVVAYTYWSLTRAVDGGYVEVRDPHPEQDRRNDAPAG